MTVNRFHGIGTSGVGAQIELVIERIQFKRVVMIEHGRCAWSEIAGEPAYVFQLFPAVGQISGRDTLGELGGVSRNKL